MQFSRALLAALFAAIAAAQGEPNAFNVPKSGNWNGLEAGGSETFTWRNREGSTVTIRLRDGPNGNLNEGEVIADRIPNEGTFTWNIPEDIEEGATYTLEIVNDEDPEQTNFTSQFVISSDNKATPSSASASASAASTASESSASASASESASSASESASSASASASSSASASASESASASSSASASASESSASESASATEDSASAEDTSVPNTNGVGMVKVGSSLIAVGAAFAWLL